MQIDTIDQRSGNARLVSGAARVRAAADGEARFAYFAAAARIHRRDQHEAGRVGDTVIGAGHRDLAILQRLAQRIEHLRLEFRQLVEKQNAVMGKRHLARPRMQTAAARAGMLAE